MRSAWRAKGLVLLLLAGLSSGCAELVRYSDDLVDPRTGRTLFTRTPAAFGGVVGFLVGVPIDIVGLPVTYIVYSNQDEVTREPLSIFLFPSFVLWRVGTLVGAPFDLVEWACWRSWQPEPALTREERERREAALDGLEWLDPTVVPIYPVKNQN